MENFDSAYASAFQKPAAPDLISYFSQGFNMANAMPFSPQAVRQRQIEDYQLQLKNQAIQAQAARYQQQMALKQQLLPFQIARLQHLAQGKPTPADYSGTIADIDAFTAGQHAPVVTPDQTQAPQPDALPASMSSPTGPAPRTPIDPDAPAL